MRRARISASQQFNRTLDVDGRVHAQTDRRISRERVRPHAPDIVLALAAMLIATAAGCSTLMEPDHADPALLETNSGLSVIHHSQDSNVTGKI